MTCLFCQIASGKTAAQLYYEDEWVCAFRDINPQAPVHFLVIPKKHITTLNDAVESDHPILGHMLTTASQIAKQEGIDESGYRTLMNCNADGGQTVFHIHLHLLGGRTLNWPPG